MTKNTTRFDDFMQKIGEKFSSLICRSVSGLERSSDKLEQNNRVNFYVIIFIAASSFAVMFLLNYLTPLAADDFNYQFVYWDNCTADTKISSLSDIYTSMVYHYNYINGRVILHSIVELFAVIGKPLFNIANSLMYVALTLLIYKHCKGPGRGRHNAVLFLVINLMLWVFVGSWGQTFVWMDGSVNYLWGSAIRLSALLPFRLYADEKSKTQNKWYFAVIMLIWSAVAGATNENTGAALVGMMALFIIFYRVRRKALPVWSFTGFFGALAGFTFMALAPANSIRNDIWSESGNTLIKRLINIPGNSVLNLAVPAMLYVISAYLLYKFGGKDKSYRISVSFIYILGVFGGIYTMLATPYFPTRVWFGITVTMIIALGNLLYQFRITPAVCRRSVAVAAVFGSLYCAMSLAKTVEDAINVKSSYNQRVEYIKSEKESGKLSVELEPITPEDEHSPLYGLCDISDNPDNWSNQSKAAYYGLDSVTAAED